MRTAAGLADMAVRRWIQEWQAAWERDAPRRRAADAMMTDIALDQALWMFREVPR